MKKIIGFADALKLLKEGHTMVHSTKPTINGLTIVHPSFHYLIPYCTRAKQKNGDVFYTIKEAL